MLGEERWQKLMEMAERGELQEHGQRFFEMLESNEIEGSLTWHEFRELFPRNFIGN